MKKSQLRNIIRESIREQIDLDSGPNLTVAPSLARGNHDVIHMLKCNVPAPGHKMSYWKNLPGRGWVPNRQAGSSVGGTWWFSQHAIQLGDDYYNGGCIRLEDQNGNLVGFEDFYSTLVMYNGELYRAAPKNSSYMIQPNLGIYFDGPNHPNSIIPGHYDGNNQGCLNPTATIIHLGTAPYHPGCMHPPMFDTTDYGPSDKKEDPSNTDSNLGFKKSPTIDRMKDLAFQGKSIHKPTIPEPHGGGGGAPNFPDKPGPFPK